MRRNEYKLFSPGKIAHLSIKNRLIRAATYEGAMTEEGSITPEIINLYSNLAKGGVGAIITGHMTVAREGKASDRQTCIYDDFYIAEIAKIAEVVHASGNVCLTNSKTLADFVGAVTLFNNQFDGVILEFFGIFLPCSFLVHRTPRFHLW